MGDLLQIKHALYCRFLYVQVVLPLIALSAIGWIAFKFNTLPWHTSKLKGITSD